MTSQLNVDTIVDKAGSGGTNIKVGNDATYISDAGASASDFKVVESLVKSWVRLVALLVQSLTVLTLVVQMTMVQASMMEILQTCLSMQTMVVA